MKTLTAKELLRFLTDIQKQGNDLSKIVVNHRAHRDADVEPVQKVEEDLFDAETNNTLESIVLINDATEL